MLIRKIKCEVCGKEFKSVTHTHTMKEHGMTLKEYMQMYPDAPIHAEQLEQKESERKTLLLDALNKSRFANK